MKSEMFFLAIIFILISVLSRFFLPGMQKRSPGGGGGGRKPISGEGGQPHSIKRKTGILRGEGEKAQPPPRWVKH